MLPEGVAFFLADYVLTALGCSARRFRFEFVEGFIQSLLLLQAGGLARELGAIDIGIAGHAANAHDELAQCLAGKDSVDPRVGKFAIHAHVLGLLILRDGHFVAGEDGDFISGLQCQILGGILVQHRPAEVERDGGLAQIRGIQPDDVGEFPVDIAAQPVTLEIVPVVVVVDQPLGVGNDVGDFHAFAPREAPRRRAEQAALQYHIRLGLRQGFVGGVDGDDVPRLQQQILLLVAQNRDAEIEGMQTGRQGGFFQPLNHGEIPVDLALLHLAGEAALVLPIVERVGDEVVVVAQKIGDAHAGMPGIAGGQCHVPLQGNGIVETRRQRLDPNQIAVLDRLGEAVLVEGEFVDRPDFTILNAFQQHVLTEGRGGQPARHRDQIIECLLALEFEDRGDVHAAADGGELPNGRNEDDIAGKKLRVLRFVALEEKIVDIELGDDSVGALQLDTAHRALGAGPAGCKQRIDQRGKRTDRVGAGLSDLADHENLDGAQFAQSDDEIEILEDAGHRAAHARIEILITRRRDIDRADLGNVDAAIAIDCRAHIDIDLAPGTHQNLIARADHVVGGDGYALQRRKGAGAALEQLIPEQF